MDKALYDRGMTMRRKVLGDEYVDRAVANTDDFNRQFQELLTTYCWGAVWGDDALKPRDRSILNLGMIACLGRMHEFEAHWTDARRAVRDFAAGRGLLRVPRCGGLSPGGQTGARGGSQKTLRRRSGITLTR
jgi:Carboxymuconolactone decarboxylase family